MELRKPRPTGSNSETANNLQHQAAMRITARFEAETRAVRRAAFMRSLKTFVSVVLLLVVAGGGYWAWKSGLLDAYIGTASETERKGTANVIERLTGGRQEKADTDSDVKVDAQREVARIDENMAASRTLAASFEGASVDLWENAVPEDRPAKGKPALVFAGLVPDGKAGQVLLQVTIESGRPLQVKKLSPVHGLVEISKAEFDKLIASTPYLVAREQRAYLSTPAKKKRSLEFSIPGKNGSLDPSYEIFGSILPKIDALKMKRPAHRYEVSLELKNLKKSIPVAVVGLGETVSRNDFLVALQKELNDRETCEMLLSAGTAKVKIVK